MAGADIGVSDFAIFEDAASNADAAAAQAREHATALRSAIVSAASGIQGTHTAAALHRLAERLTKDIDHWAEGLAETAQAARDTGESYSATDAKIESLMKAAGR